MKKNKPDPINCPHDNVKDLYGPDYQNHVFQQCKDCDEIIEAMA